MTERIARKLDFRRGLFLSAAGSVAVAVPIVFGLLNGMQSRAASQQAPNTAHYEYEVASIKPVKSGNFRVTLWFSPNGLTGKNITLHMLIRTAYGVEDHQISGGPNWLDSDHFEVEAKMDSSTADALHKLSEDQRMLEREQMLQALLADRFRLTVHRETKELPMYALVVAKNGSKLQEAKPGDTYPQGIKGPDGVGRQGLMRMERGQVTGRGLDMTFLARLLTQELGRTVLDKTGLTGNYDFTLQFKTDDSQGAMFKGPESGQPSPAETPSPDSSGPSIFTALQEQLGLKLESKKGAVDILVIDHAERPPEN
jgi:uncharacterized protein (TIGR03435 family)